MNISKSLMVLLLLAICHTAFAQPAPPSILRQVGIDQKLGSVIPGDLVFTDETGRTIHLQDCLGKRPTILALVYFQCPMLCTMVLNDLVRAMRLMPENLGQDYDVLCVSFDPRDTPQIAAQKRLNYLATYNRPGNVSSWHFLTGSSSSIASLTHSVGFRYVWDEKNQVYAHASGIIILTPEGKISRYFYGIDYAPKDLRIALTEASAGRTGGLADAILTYCFHYDPATGKYGLAVDHALKAGGVLFCVALGSSILLMIRRDRRGLAENPSPAITNRQPPEQNGS